MSKTNKTRTKSSQETKKLNRESATFARAKAVARGGLSTAKQYADYVNAANMDYVLDSRFPDPRIIFSGVAKRVQIANAQIRAAGLLGKGQKHQFFLTE